MQSGSYIVGTQSGEYNGKIISLSADGSTVAIGSPYYNAGSSSIVAAGRVRVYRNSGSVWAQWGVDIEGTQANEYCGYAVSLSYDGNTIVIGSPYYDTTNTDVGRVRIYTNSGSGWIQWGSNIEGILPGDYYGWSVSLSNDGKVVAIGTPYYSSPSNTYAVRARVYRNSGSGWTQWGADMAAVQTYEQSGWSVSLSFDGKTIAIGSRYYNTANNLTAAGRVRVYRNTTSGWTQWGADVEGTQDNENCGWSISLSYDGNTIAIGSPYYDTTAKDSGRARVYRNSGSGWIQLGTDIVGNQINEYNGYSVSLSYDGNTVAVGSPYYDTSTNGDSGRVRVYRDSGSEWIQWGPDMDGTQTNEYYGSSVSLSYYGNITAAGSTGYASNAGRVAVYATIVTPSSQPTGQPTSQPSLTPTRQPTGQPSTQPSSQPSSQPSRVPSSVPSSSPSGDPSSQPSKVPSSLPSSSPTKEPSSQPSTQPTVVPSSAPSYSPSNKPSSQPTSQPTTVPSSAPSAPPSNIPSSQPSNEPSSQPSTQPTV
eukprot:scaffold1302_cov165-Ochromonas_danica.AAC.1